MHAASFFASVKRLLCLWISLVYTNDTPRLSSSCLFPSKKCPGPCFRYFDKSEFGLQVCEPVLQVLMLQQSFVKEMQVLCILGEVHMPEKETTVNGVYCEEILALCTAEPRIYFGALYLAPDGCTTSLSLLQMELGNKPVYMLVNCKLCQSN